jgi:hypothetical protein
MLRPVSWAKVAVCAHSFANAFVLCHCLLGLAVHFSTGVARDNEPLSGPRACVEPGHPKKFGTMFFEDRLRLLGGLDHFLGLVAFKARELRDRYTLVPSLGICG